MRDVEQNLRRSRESLLARILHGGGFDEDEAETLVQVMGEANALIEGHDAIGRAGTAISASLDSVAGEAFTMGVRIGVSAPSVDSVVRSLRLLLSDRSMDDFDLERNGLGLNNLLYVAMLIEVFRTQTESGDTGWQLMLIEEPEAHLHPQLQRVLHNALVERGPQVLLTTHSTHISSIAPLGSFVVLTRLEDAAVSSTRPSEAAVLNLPQQRDLERYLDATRSELMFARRVMLVEGPSEAFLIPILAKVSLGIDLDQDRQLQSSTTLEARYSASHPARIRHHHRALHLPRGRLGLNRCMTSLCWVPE